MIDPQLSEWASQLLRWVHVITAIAWIGSSFYFIHLDLSLKKPEGLPAGVGGEAWQVHGGGFYRMRKYVIAPPELPGRADLVQMGELRDLDLRLLPAGLGSITCTPSCTRSTPPSRRSRPGRRRRSGSARLVLGWIVYDQLCKSPLGDNDARLGAVVFAFIVAAAFGFTLVFNGRGRVPAHRRHGRDLDVGLGRDGDHPEPEEGGRGADRRPRPRPGAGRRRSSARRTTTT